MAHTLGLIIAMTAAAAVSAGPAAPIAGADCHEVKLIAARGSGDTLNDIGIIGVKISGALARKANALGIDYKVHGLKYTAVGIDWKKILFPLYVRSKNEGRDNLRALVQQETKDCPTQRLVLVGFSQGAHVVGDVLSKKVGGLKKDELKRIAAVALIADPRFNSREPFATGDNLRPGHNGILGARSPGDLDAVTGKVRSWCRRSDIVCQGLPGLPGVHDQHAYFAAYGDEIVDFIAEKLGWSRAAPLNWSAPERLSAATSSDYPYANIARVAIGADGSAIVAWARYLSGNRYIVEVCTRENGNWSRPRAISKPSSPTYDFEAPLPHVTAGGQTPAVAWSHGERRLYRAAVATRRNKSWLPSTLISQGVDSGIQLDIASNARGDAALVWEERIAVRRTPGQSPVAEFRVAASVRPSGGQWSAPETLGLSHNPGQVPLSGAFPSVAVSGDGTVAVMWAGDVRSPTAQNSIGGYVARAVRRPVRGSWSVPVDVSELSPTASSQLLPQIVAGRTGTFVAAWQRYVPSRQGFLLESAELKGRRWSKPVAISRAPAASGPTFDLAATSGGGAFLSWTEQRRGSWVALLSRRPRSTWTVPVATATTRNSEGGLPLRQIAIVDESTAVLVWEERGRPTSSVRARTISLSGHWSAVKSLSPRGESAGWIDVAGNERGEVVTAWTSTIPDRQNVVRATIGVIAR